MNRLANSEELSEISRGGVTRLLLAIFNEEFAKSSESNVDGFYDTLKKELVQAFLSYAGEDALDAIGYMMYCKRYVDEKDEPYRYRISQQLLSMATSNETAVRLACLSVPGVDDVIMKAYTHGTGSGSIYVINKDPAELPNLIKQVTTAARMVGGWGTRIDVFQPRFLNVEIRIRIIFYKDVSELDQNLIRGTAKISTEDYLASRNAGEPLDVKYIEEIVSKISLEISEVQIYYLTVNEETVLLVKQLCAWNERFIPTRKGNAVIIS